MEPTNQSRQPDRQGLAELLAQVQQRSEALTGPRTVQYAVALVRMSKGGPGGECVLHVDELSDEEASELEQLASDVLADAIARS
jgi:hypothetical protein